MSDIFVSYSHDDRIKVSRLVRALEAQGWTVWWDRESIPGTLWDQTIARELKSAKCALVAWSQSSVGSGFVKQEAGLALGQDKLVPVTLDQTAPPHQFNSIETLDLSRWLGSASDPNFVLLQRGIQRIAQSKIEAIPAVHNKINKNRSGLKVWGITVGGTFFGFASGVIAKPLAAVAVAMAIAIGGTGGYVFVSRSTTNTAKTYSTSGNFSCFGEAEYPDSWRGEAPLCTSYGCLFGKMPEAACLTLGAKKGSKTVIHGNTGTIRANECWLQHSCGDLRPHSEFTLFRM